MKEQRPFHFLLRFQTMWQSRPLAVAILFFALGIAAGFLWAPANGWLILLLVLAALLLITGLFCHRYVLYLPAVFCLGVLWLTLSYAPIAEFSLESGSVIEVTGEIVELNIESEYRFSFVLQPNDHKNWPGRLMVYCRNQSIHAADFSYGDHVALQGIVGANQITNPGVFDYGQYLRERKIVASIFLYQDGRLTLEGENTGNPFMKLALTCKSFIQQNLTELPPKLRGYVEGILFGEKSGISDQDLSVLSRSGIMHIFAVSGLHVGFVLLFSGGVARRLKLKGVSYLVVSLFPAFVYGAMAGFTPSVCRALVMSTVGLLAYVLGDESDPYTALALAALVCLLERPTVLLDVGFQLSFLAVFGILYITPLFQQVLPAWHGLGNAIAVSLGAQLAVTPVIAHSFHILTLLGVLLSPLAVVVAAITVIGGLLTLPLMLLGVGGFYMQAIGILIQGVVSLSEMCLQLPFFWQKVLSPSLIFLCMYYLVLLFLPCILKSPRPKLYSLLGVVLLIVFILVPGSASSGRLTLTYLDVGEGAAMVIETPDGEHILINGGGTNADPAAVGYNVVVPYLEHQGVKELTAVINTHPHADHGGGLLAVLAEIPTNQLLLATGTETEFLTAELLTEAHNNRVPVGFLSAGDQLTLDHNITLDVLSGGAYGKTVNDNALVFLLRYGEIDFLITSDVGLEVLEDLPLENPEQIDVLEMAHHGSPYSFAPELYHSYQPQGVIITVGAENSYGHPAPEILTYWQERQVPLYRTDEDGAVSFITDGKELQVRTVLP